MNNKFAEDILRNIATGGTVEKTVNPIIGSNLTQILDLGSGAARIKRNIRFHLILSQPQALSILNPFEIRCCLCKKVISYPAWYWSIRYAVNHFHYFVCFDADSPSKPSVKCYRRDI